MNTAGTSSLAQNSVKCDLDPASVLHAAFSETAVHSPRQTVVFSATEKPRRGGPRSLLHFTYIQSPQSTNINMVMQLAPPPSRPPLDAPPNRTTPPSRRRRRHSMERMVPSIDGVSAALGLGRPTAPSPPPKPVKKIQFGEVEEKLFSFDW